MLHLLGFNEPDFLAQANLAATQTASYWGALQDSAGRAGTVAVVSSAMNFCRPAASCNGTDPYAYPKAFFPACPRCRVDHIALHRCNCDLPSLLAI